mmetsp:Transcript_10571/g.23306  ORF Transcript_10571/g.23306 Transcript_10571/m.23306 type:complete len:87 (+) Transcript_10571:2168-2428(+)
MLEIPCLGCSQSNPAKRAAHLFREGGQLWSELDRLDSGNEGQGADEDEDGVAVENEEKTKNSEDWEEQGSGESVETAETLDMDIMI